LANNSPWTEKVDGNSITKINFCHRPWTEMHIEENGNITPCCVMPSNIHFVANGIENYQKSDKLKEIKEYFLKNKQHPHCQFCWDAERNGVRSQRDKDKTDLTNLKKIHLRFNNICNFKCRMCNPKFSSTWAEENNIHKYFVHDYTLDKDIFETTNNLYKLILDNRDTIKQINISGGEPLITKVNYKFLQFLIDNNLTHITIAYSTNLSKVDYNDVDLVSIFKKFNKILLSVSVDGYGSHVEYSRHGFNWNIFIKNLEKVRSFISNLVCVVNIYSVYSIPQLQQFAEKNNFTISYQPCLYPKFLSIQSLPRKEKLHIIKFYDKVRQTKHIKNFTLLKNNVLSYMMNEQIDSYSINKVIYNCNAEFKLFNELLDKTRGESFINIFPQFKNWYKEI
jgi:MoaA/NifB/PqqE/SkfB family radical SAM enzyme